MSIIVVEAAIGVVAIHLTDLAPWWKIPLARVGAFIATIEEAASLSSSVVVIGSRRITTMGGIFVCYEGYVRGKWMTIEIFEKF